MHKLEEEIQSITGNEKEKWVLGTSFTALDINLAVSLHRLTELGYESLLGDKPGLQQFWSMVKLRPGFQAILLRKVNVADSGLSIETQGAGATLEDTDRDITKSSSLHFQDSLEEEKRMTDSSIDNVSDVTSPEPTSSNDNGDGGKVKKQRKKQRKRQNEDRTWYSLW